MFIRFSDAPIYKLFWQKLILVELLSILSTLHKNQFLPKSAEPRFQTSSDGVDNEQYRNTITGRVGLNTYLIVDRWTV